MKTISILIACLFCIIFGFVGAAVFSANRYDRMMDKIIEQNVEIKQLRDKLIERIGNDEM